MDENTLFGCYSHDEKGNKREILNFQKPDVVKGFEAPHELRDFAMEFLEEDEARKGRKQLDKTSDDSSNVMKSININAWKKEFGI